MPTISINYLTLQTTAMMITALLIPKLRVTSILGAFFCVAGLALVNATIWDTGLFSTLPNSFSSHTLAIFVANGMVFWVIVKLLPGIDVEGILPALVAPLVFSLSSIAVNEYGRDVDWRKLATVAAENIEKVRDELKQGQEQYPETIEKPEVTQPQVEESED